MIQNPLDDEYAYVYTLESELIVCQWLRVAMKQRDPLLHMHFIYAEVQPVAAIKIFSASQAENIQK